MLEDAVEGDTEYYRKRAEQELQLAQSATDPKVVAAHYQLSQLYLEKLLALEGPQEPSRPSD